VQGSRRRRFKLDAGLWGSVKIAGHLCVELGRARGSEKDTLPEWCTKLPLVGWAKKKKKNGCWKKRLGPHFLTVKKSERKKINKEGWVGYHPEEWIGKSLKLPYSELFVANKRITSSDITATFMELRQSSEETRAMKFMKELDRVNTASPGIGNPDVWN